MLRTTEFPPATVPDWSHFSAILAPEPGSAAKSRAFVSRHLAEHQLPHLEDNIRLVASELATNAVVHAQTPFTMTLSRTGSRVLLSATDSAPRAPRRRSPRVGDEGGYGLIIMELLSLAWGVTRDENQVKTIWASFDAHPAA